MVEASHISFKSPSIPKKSLNLARQLLRVFRGTGCDRHGGPGASDDSVATPRVTLELPELMVLEKPPGWEVYGDTRSERRGQIGCDVAPEKWCWFCYMEKPMKMDDLWNINRVSGGLMMVNDG